KCLAVGIRELGTVAFQTATDSRVKKSYFALSLETFSKKDATLNLHPVSGKSFAVGIRELSPVAFQAATNSSAQESDFARGFETVSKANWAVDSCVFRVQPLFYVTAQQIKAPQLHILQKNLPRERTFPCQHGKFNLGLA